MACKNGEEIARSDNQVLFVVGLLQDEVDPMVSVNVEKAPLESYADIGGLDAQIQEIKEAVELHPELYEDIGIKPPKAVILYPEPGTGKTLLDKAVANSTSPTFLRGVGGELIQKYLVDGQKLVREIFAVADDLSPSIVFIDEIDAVGTKRYAAHSGGERGSKRTMMELLNQLDGFDSRGDAKVFLATNRIESLDPALLRPGRIDRKIEFPLLIHMSRMTLSDDVNLDEFVMTNDEFSGANIIAICTEAGLLALRERRMKVLFVVGLLQDEVDPMVPVMKFEKAPLESYADIGGLDAQIQEIKEAVELPLTHPVPGLLLAEVDPMVSGMIVEKAPLESYADIGGLDAQIQEIKEAVELPLTHLDLYEDIGIKPPKGVILYGEPGTGKTLLSKAMRYNDRVGKEYLRSLDEYTTSFFEEFKKDVSIPWKPLRPDEYTVVLKHMKKLRNAFSGYLEKQPWDIVLKRKFKKAYLYKLFGQLKASKLNVELLYINFNGEMMAQPYMAWLTECIVYRHKMQMRANRFWGGNNPYSKMYMHNFGEGHNPRRPVYVNCSKKDFDRIVNLVALAEGCISSNLSDTVLEEVHLIRETAIRLGIQGFVFRILEELGA